MENDIKQKLVGVVENELLSNHTTFKIGGPARYFFVAKNKEDLLLAIQSAEELGLPYFVLGWGSNLLVSDEGFAGLVIKNKSENISISDHVITAESGVNLSKIIGEATKAGLSGLEFGAGIPGTIGGACFGNAGAYGQSFGDFVQSIEVYQNHETKILTKDQLSFDYRESILKKAGGVVLSVKIELQPAKPEVIQAKIIEILRGRKGRVPIEPSAGSVFKNIDLKTISVDPKRIIKELDISLEEWEKTTAHGKLAVSFIIDHLNLKGKIIGGCQVSEKHGGFLVNIGSAQAQHVLMMISDIKMRVRDQLGIQLHEEIRYLGF